MQIHNARHCRNPHVNRLLDNCTQSSTLPHRLHWRSQRTVKLFNHYTSNFSSNLLPNACRYSDQLLKFSAVLQRATPHWAILLTGPVLIPSCLVVGKHDCLGKVAYQANCSQSSLLLARHCTDVVGAWPQSCI